LLSRGEGNLVAKVAHALIGMVIHEFQGWLRRYALNFHMMGFKNLSVLLEM